MTPEHLVHLQKQLQRLNRRRERTVSQSLTPSALEEMISSLKTFLADKGVDPENLYKAMKVGINGIVFKIRFICY